MRELLVSNNKEYKLNDTELFCTLNKSQYITIPIHIRKLLSLSAGDEVTVSLTKNSSELIIQKRNHVTFENTMVITGKGSIRIPEELKRTLCLQMGDTFQIYLSKENQLILLKIK